MIRDLLLIPLFFMSALLQLAVLQSFTPPFSFFPAHFLMGVLVMHRRGPEIGAVWFLGSAILLPIFGFDPVPWYAYVFIAIIGVLFSTRLFTNRSVYALQGLALTLYSIVLICTSIRTPGFLSVQQMVFMSLFVLLLSYLGFLVAKGIEAALERLFLTKFSHDA